MFSAPIIETALLLVHQLFPDVRRPSRSSPWRLTSRSRGCSWTRSPSPSEASDGRRNSFSDKSISNTLSTIVIYDSSVVNYDCLAFMRLTNKSPNLVTLVTVQLVSSCTSLGSTASLHTNINILSFLVKSSLVKLETSRTVTLHPTVSFLWLGRLSLSTVEELSGFYDWTWRFLCWNHLLLIQSINDGHLLWTSCSQHLIAF